jgi:aminoglycoside 2''-phosphotransferase
MDTDLTPYLDRIRHWDADLEVASAQPNPYGLNNFVVLVNDELIFRFPRTDEGRTALRQEAALLALVRDHIDTPVPAFTYDAALDFVVYPLVSGVPIYRHDLLLWPDEAQAVFARQLGRFLHQLHTIPSEPLTAVLGAPDHDLPGMWDRRLAAVRDLLFPHLWADQQAWVASLFAPVTDGRLDMRAYTPCLTHGDLASYHLLGDPASGSLTGVLDFGEARWGDPAIDLAAVISSYGESFLWRMAETYPLTNDLVERARLRAGYVELEWAMQGVKLDSTEWYLVHIGRARDVRPFGAFPQDLGI